MNEELESLSEAFTQDHLVTRWNWDTETQELITAEPLLEVLRQVKMKERAAVGSGTGAATQGSRVALSLTAVDIEQEIKRVTGKAGCAGSMTHRIKAYCETATPLNEEQRASQLSRWAYSIDSLVTRKTSQLELKGECPACLASHAVYRKPGNGTAVGTALVVVTDIDAQDSTAYCRACGSEWSRGQLHDLALLIA